MISISPPAANLREGHRQKGSLCPACVLTSNSFGCAATSKPDCFAGSLRRHSCMAFAHADCLPYFPAFWVERPVPSMTAFQIFKELSHGLHLGAAAEHTTTLFAKSVNEWYWAHEVRA